MFAEAVWVRRFLRPPRCRRGRCCGFGAVCERVVNGGTVERWRLVESLLCDDDDEAGDELACERANRDRCADI